MMLLVGAGEEREKGEEREDGEDGEEREDGEEGRRDQLGGGVRQRESSLRSAQLVKNPQFVQLDISERPLSSSRQLDIQDQPGYSQDPDFPLDKLNP